MLQQQSFEPKTWSGGAAARWRRREPDRERMNRAFVGEARPTPANVAPAAPRCRLGIVIEKPILELLDIDRETELEMRTDGERLIIEPIRGARGAKVKAGVQRAVTTHDATLRKLAK